MRAQPSWATQLGERLSAGHRGVLEDSKLPGKQEETGRKHHRQGLHLPTRARRGSEPFHQHTLHPPHSPSPPRPSRPIFFFSMRFQHLLISLHLLITSPWPEPTFSPLVPPDARAPRPLGFLWNLWNSEGLRTVQQAGLGPPSILDQHTLPGHCQVVRLRRGSAERKTSKLRCQTSELLSLTEGNPMQKPMGSVEFSHKEISQLRHKQKPPKITW